ncbi:MAG: hypothetical protein AAF468_11795 [Pseudomonadota bacterium]
MPKKKMNQTMPTITLQFAGEKGAKMAEHFFTDWLDGGLDEIWEERVRDAGIVNAIDYMWDSDNRVIVIMEDKS